MMKSPREPIFLTKFKKKCREADSRREGIEYDLFLFQESLNMHKEIQKNEQPSQIPIQERSKITESATERRGGDEKQIKNWSEMVNVHKTKMSLRPNAVTTRNKENAILQQPNVLNLKARAISSVNRENPNPCALKQTILFSNIPQIQPQKDHPNQLKNFYQSKMEQYFTKENESIRKIAELEQKVKLEQQEKQKMFQRIENIQKDLNVLYQQNQELQKMSHCLSKSSLGQYRQDKDTQTFMEPKFVQDSYCQTNAEPFHIFKYESVLRNQCQDWYARALYYMYELEKHEMLAINREKQFQIVLENTHREYQWRINALERQLFTASRTTF